ncbi:head-tail connector protein [Alkalithermobacter paradoxus]|uniref:Phage gp6-like head-tail connector protein n=1 Tax=Alkalithermobacter paradoxus TaxID=29349 RepID=A0A1V4I7M0_9FIRM|nr:phage gp6-like head-tail connector protein [[Clostridium] thermoalcaliphilum]
MAIKIITPPIVEPITLEEAKNHLRVDGNDDDILIMSLIKQAREWCEDYQNRKYITQTLELVLDTFPNGNAIVFNSCSPIQKVESIKYYDENRQEYLFDESNYIVDLYGFVNRVVLNRGKHWPTVELQSVNAVRVRIVAGYGDTPDKVPETVKWAMILQMKLLYDDYRPEEKTKLEEARNALLSMNRVIPV